MNGKHKVSMTNLIEKIEKEPGFIKELCLEDRTRELCKIAIEADLDLLPYVPDNYFDNDFFEGVYITEDVFDNIPERLRSQYLCEKAFRECMNVLDEIPEQFKTERFFLEAIYDNQWGMNFLLEIMDRKHVTDEICHAAIQYNIIEFEYVPDEFKTKELCIKAVKIDSSMLKFVPETHQNECKKVIS